MKPWLNLRDALQSIYSHGLRSLLTMLSIVIGVAALIAMLSIGVGAQRQIAEQIRSLGANVLIVVPKAERNSAAADGPGNRPIALTVADGEAAAATIPEVSASAPALQLEGRLVYGNRNWSTRINGTTAAYFFIRDWPLVAGRIFSRRDEMGAGKVAVIGQTVAKRLFGDTNPVGREVRVMNTPLRVVGQLAPKGLSGYGRDQDDVVFVPYKTARLRLGAERGIKPDKVTYILFKAVSDGLVATARTHIEGLLRQRFHLAPGRPSGFEVSEPAETMAAKQSSSRTIAWLLAAIASISLVVGGISIMNIMLVSVAERTREIGLRLALGASRLDITWLFLTEALLICIAGGILGASLGAAISWAIGRLAGWPILVTPVMMFSALMFAACVGLFFGFLPARRAARLSPAAALRSA